MRLFKKLRRKLDYLEPAKVELIQQAYMLALEAHRGQKRRTGEPYITHPVAVACILADMEMDNQAIMAALLHDVIEDTPVEKATIAEQFGNTVADLVDGVSKLTQIEFVSRAEAQAENFRKMVLAMANDIRVIIVKLADRLHNMRTLGSLPAMKRRRIARETLEIFAPVAKRLGMRDFSVELEELGFQARYPRRCIILKEAVRRARGNRKKVLNIIDKALNEGLTQSQLPTFVITGREKHLYSIYRKMKVKRIPFEEIMDVYAFRIVVDKIDSCYRVLGVVHQLFKPVPERFKDYIALPKVNGYQSLHTTLFGPYGLPIEVQIRTTEMDQMATSGIASHWLYKSEERQKSKSHVRAQQWVQNLLDLQQRSGSTVEFFESVKVDLFPNEVYVFTPKGDIKELPGGATAVDYAYAVHTDIGNSMVAIKVDRQLSPLSTVLLSGQTLEVVTSEHARPNPAWLDFVVTSKARSSIRHYLKNRRKSESMALGKKLLEKAVGQHGLTLKKLPNAAINFVLNEAGLANFDALLEDIGLGNRAASLLAQHLTDVVGKVKQEGDINLSSSAEVPLLIQGTEGMALKFSECCNPIPGDAIVGVLQIGRGVAVHVDRCKQIAKLHRHAEELISLRWAEDVRGEFATAVQAQVGNQKGVLAVMALAISDTDASIEDIKMAERDGQHFFVEFKILVKNRQHFAQVLRRLRKLPSIIKVIRK